MLSGHFAHCSNFFVVITTTDTTNTKNKNKNKNNNSSCSSHDRDEEGLPGRSPSGGPSVGCMGAGRRSLEERKSSIQGVEGAVDPCENGNKSFDVLSILAHSSCDGGLQQPMRHMY